MEEEKSYLNRIRSYHRKARNILEDWARKTSLEIVMMAKRLGYTVAIEDLTGLINSLRKIKNKDHRTKLIIMGLFKAWEVNILAGLETRGSTSHCKAKRDIIGMPKMRFKA